MEKLQELVKEYWQMQNEYQAFWEDYNAPGAMNTDEDAVKLEILAFSLSEKKMEIADAVIDFFDIESRDDRD